ncbi:hypothetical protein B0T25DRAFT_536597 [Lasiosphaeria hispida]|uniref:Uncharacterized protein n=1 Tax=Lasiosphaeria hispida TaxID=260671 RepID=A0AAJ0HK40_9PEZI|nr:hypothetical protein B0T25DRAFT_536597 [Lasiosphaeria hispida]
MQSATEELRAKLCLEPDESTKLTDRLSFSRELKHSESSPLRKNDCDGFLAKIKAANSVMHELAGHSCNLEPTRHHSRIARHMPQTRSQGYTTRMW